MPNAVLRRNLATGRAPNNGALNGVVYDSETQSTAGALFYKFTDEPESAFTFASDVTAGQDALIPIDPKGREMVFKVVSRTAKGAQSVSAIEDGEQTLFNPSEAPALASATFNTPDIDLVFASNGGVGTIRILRSIDAGAFGQVGTVAYSATTFSDTATVNGDYAYKLTQDGQDGESNAIEVEVTGIGGGAGTAPTPLSAVFDDVDTVTLDWTNNSGTGDVIVERKYGSGSFFTIATLADTAITYDDVLLAPPHGRIYTYRVSNTSAAGYSNEVAVYIPSGW